MSAVRFVADRRELRHGWRVLLHRLRWRDRRFFPLFDLHAALCIEGLQALIQLLSNIGEPNGRVRDIEAIEKRADGIVDEVRAAVRHSMFPPYPRATIVSLINRLDDVLDLTEDAAESIHLYHVTAVTPEALRLAELALDSGIAMQQAVGLLADGDRTRELLVLCSRVDEIEAQADHVMRAAMSKLFRDEADTRQLIKLKAVYESLEGLTDCTKDVASELEAMVLGQIGA